jgi:hypothetical protein
VRTTLIFAGTDFFLLFFQIRLQVFALGDQLFAQLLGFLKISSGGGGIDFTFQSNLTLGDLGGVSGIQFSQLLFLCGSQFHGGRSFIEPFHRKFVGGFHGKL